MLPTGRWAFLRSGRQDSFGNPLPLEQIQTIRKTRILPLEQVYKSLVLKKKSGKFLEKAVMAESTESSKKINLAWILSTSRRSDGTM